MAGNRRWTEAEDEAIRAAATWQVTGDGRRTKIGPSVTRRRFGVGIKRDGIGESQTGVK